MLAYARRRVDLDTADDVVGEALLVLWRRRHELFRSVSSAEEEGRDHEVAWAIGITRGCLANTKRSLRRHLALVDKLGKIAPRLDEDRPAPAERDDRLHAALRSLHGEDQELLRLWAWDDLKPAQIATVLGTNPENVSVRLYRAKQRLSRALQAPKPDATQTTLAPPGSLP